MLGDLRVVWRYLTLKRAPRCSDVLFCFRSFHFCVARRAAELFVRRVAPFVIVTGGEVGRIAPFTTEADGYLDVLTSAGVPRSCIIVERRARNTGENARLGMIAAAERGVQVRAATLVAWPTALRRCAATFWRWHPRVHLYTQPAFRGFGPYAGNLAEWSPT